MSGEALIDEKELRHLAEIYDKRPVFLTLYSDLRHGVAWHFIDKRVRRVRTALHDDWELLYIFEENLDKGMEILRSLDHARGSAAVFVSIPHDLAKCFVIPPPIQDMLIVDSSPYIRPLLEFMEEYEPMAILVVDENHAKLFIVEGGEISRSQNLKEAIIHHHKKGGWSQMRFQRVRRGALNRFYKEVILHLTKLMGNEMIGRIVLAGPGIAKDHIEEYFPENLRNRIIGKVDIDIGTPDDQILRHAFKVFFERERIEEALAVDSLRSEILKGGLAVYGFDETYASVASGRAELVLLLLGLQLPGWKCERCRYAWLSTMICPYCGDPTARVDAVEELVEKAEEMNTRLEFVKESEYLKGLGGVAAMLRY